METVRGKASIEFREENLPTMKRFIAARNVKTSTVDCSPTSDPADENWVDETSIPQGDRRRIRRKFIGKLLRTIVASASLFSNVC